LTDAALPSGARARSHHGGSLYDETSRTRRRKAAEGRFKIYGAAAVCIGIALVLVLFASIVSKGYTAFTQTTVTLEVDLKQEVIDPQGRNTQDAIMTGNVFRWDELINEAVHETFGVDIDENEMRAIRAQQLLSQGSRVALRGFVADNPELIGTTQEITFLATGDVDSFLKGQINADLPEAQRQLKDDQLEMIEQGVEAGFIERGFNWGLFTNGASSRPEMAGLRGALIGSLYMVLIVLALALPIGVMASIYLEEFAPKNRWTDLIEVNINNLAAVPSIVFGILGLAVFINFFGLPRSAPVVGGLVLTLMTLPTIIITTRAALKAVPPSIREAALGVGASKMQAITHHVLPLAAPGILTGTIIGLAQALGETAPLLLIGMVAFIADAPATPFDPSTALPVQIYMWAGLAERAFVERTSAAIIVLLVFMLAMNLTAILLRKRFERRW